MSSSADRVRRLADAAARALTTLEALQRVAELRTAIDDFERRAVARALANGESMSAVARALGVSRQAAHRRFRHLTDAGTTATAEARLVVQYACWEATALGRAVGPEHVLLGILRHGDDEAVVALERTGLTLETARARLRAGGDSGDARVLLVDATRDAVRRGDSAVGVGHLLAACLRDSRVAAVLQGEATGPDSDGQAGMTRGVADYPMHADPD
jgi:transposase-like protein